MGLLDLIKRAGREKIPPQVILAELNRGKDLIKVEVESTGARFRSRVLLRSGAVVLTYPQHLEKVMKVGRWVRLRPSDQDAHELRLEISSARYGGSGEMAVELGQMSLLCKIPGAVTEESKRQHDRLSTTQFKDLRLEMAGHPMAYRILDLSQGGLRILLPEEEEQPLFQNGKTLARNATIHLGAKARVVLVRVVCRYCEKTWAGLEMEVDPEGTSQKMLDIFLNRLIHEEMKTKES